ncbi:MAG: bi-domain-containing oxidoreductase, partial [bacterium]
DRVACAGVGYASHAEMIFVPQNLAVKIPDEVRFEEAAFTTVGAIALQGVRQADVRISENAAVIGLGLIGLMTVQLLKANGCRVIGLDVSRSHFELAEQLGCDKCEVSDSDAQKTVESFTRGYGADAVVITAGTKSNQPMELALEIARKKAKVVVVGSVGMNLPRSPFFEKELDLRISCSYGPGRYDLDYEEKGRDYPIGYVRWTENRNLEAVLDLIAAQELDVQSLVTHKFDVQEALMAYDIITGKMQEKYLGILLRFPDSLEKRNGQSRTIYISQNGRKIEPANQIVAGFIGAGNFAQSNLIPPLLKSNVLLKGVVTTKPVNAKSVAKKFGFEYYSTDAQQLLADDSINTVFIVSRHDSHAGYVIDALKKGKHVFVEKPLAVNETQLQAISDALQQENGKLSTLFAGFNRRFSQPFQDMKNFFEGNGEPFVINYRVNAGNLPKTHWTMDVAQGGRIIGEGCHFIDCFAYLTGARPAQIFAEAITSQNNRIENDDNVSVTIKYEDGSVATLLYLANCSPALRKEYCEVHCEGRSAIMDNFNQTVFYEDRKSRRRKYNGSKGHKQEVAHFVRVVNGKEKTGLPVDSIFDTTITTFRILDSLKTRQFVTF